MTQSHQWQKKLPVSTGGSSAKKRRSLGKNFLASPLALLPACLFMGLMGVTSPSSAMSCDEALLGRAANIQAKTVLRRYEASETLSQKVRDNAPFYWAETRSRQPIKWQQMPAVLKSQVVAIGDLHSGNFSPVLVPGKGVLYTLFDVKDLGYAPALYDINRLVLNTVAVASRRRHLDASEREAIAREIYVSYRQGLAREDFVLTAQHQVDLPTPEKLQRKLVKKQNGKTDEDGLLSVDGESTRPLSYAAKELGLTEAEIRPRLERELRTHLGWGHLRDAIVSVKDRGGSRDQMRIMVLFETQDGRVLMKELKRVGESAVATYQDQPSLLEVQVAASRFLDYDIAVLFPQIQIGGSGFVLRDKKVETISVPYKQKEPGDFERLMELARNHAQWVGTFHGRQLFAQEAGRNFRFAEALRDHQVEIIRSLDGFNRSHMNRLTEEGP